MWRSYLKLTMKMLKVLQSFLFVKNAAIVSPLPKPPTTMSKIPMMMPNQRNSSSSFFGTVKTQGYIKFFYVFSVTLYLLHDHYCWSKNFKLFQLLVNLLTMCNGLVLEYLIWLFSNWRWCRVSWMVLLLWAFPDCLGWIFYSQKYVKPMN